jgi:hypothetical protein
MKRESEENRKFDKIVGIHFSGEQAYEILKEAIISLKLKLGERLGVSMLAEQLGLAQL